MVYGYVRIHSTDDEDAIESLIFQKIEIKRKYPKAEIVVEEWDILKSKKRPVFEEIVDKLVEGDVLVGAHFAELFISWSEAVNYIEKILDKGAIIHIPSIGKIDYSFDGKINLSIAKNSAEVFFEANKRFFSILEQRMEEVKKGSKRRK